MGGLRLELASKVRVCRPKTYTEAIEMARIRDDHLNFKRTSRPEGRRIGNSLPENKGGSSALNPGSTGNTVKPLPTGVKRLPWDELQKRRERGLCFNCDEKFTPGHKCKMRQAFLIEAADSSGDESQETGSETDVAKISVHAMAGVNGPHNMRIESWIKSQQVMVLNDNGSSHNFINQKIAKKLGLLETKVDPLRVKVASGDKLTCEVLYHNVPIKIQGVVISADLYAFPLGELDVVLGIQWLGKLGKVVIDYANGTIKFKWGMTQWCLKLEIKKNCRMWE